MSDPNSGEIVEMDGRAYATESIRKGMKSLEELLVKHRDGKKGMTSGFGTFGGTLNLKQVKLLRTQSFHCFMNKSSNLQARREEDIGKNHIHS